MRQKGGDEDSEKGEKEGDDNNNNASREKSWSEEESEDEEEKMRERARARVTLVHTEPSDAKKPSIRYVLHVFKSGQIFGGKALPFPFTCTDVTPNPRISTRNCLQKKLLSLWQG